MFRITTLAVILTAALPAHAEQSGIKALVAVTQLKAENATEARLSCAGPKTGAMIEACRAAETARDIGHSTPDELFRHTGEAEKLATSVLKKTDDTASAVIGKVK